jgi:hypothetical protein
MTRFTLKALVFLLPAILLYAFPVGIFLLGREAYTPAQMVRMQIQHPEAVVGKYFNHFGTDNYYKQLLVQAKKPQVIILGSSRGIELREQFFMDPQSFVNASVPSATLSQMQGFVESLPAEKSAVVVLELDQSLFRSDVKESPFPPPQSTQDVLSDLFTYDWRQIYLDFYLHKINLATVLSQYQESHNVGLAAYLSGDGYRSDGSRRYAYIFGPKWQEVVARSVANKVQELKKSRGSYEYGPAISLEALDTLDATLAEAQEKHLTVIGYLPPVPSAIYSEMLAEPDEYRDSTVGLPLAVDTIFKKHGFQMFDFSDDHVLGNDIDREFTDTLHVTDKMDLRILLSMAQQAPIMKTYIDTAKDQALLAGNKEDYFPLDLR